MLKCCVCSFETSSVKKYANHYRFHRNVPNLRIPCGVRECVRSFATYSSFNCHMTTNHSQLRRQAVLSRYRNIDTTFVCQIPFCGIVFSDMQSVLVHLKKHLNLRMAVPCPFKNCKKTFRLRSSFASHLFRKHSDSTDVPANTHVDISANVDISTNVAEENIMSNDDHSSDNLIDNEVDEPHVDVLFRDRYLKTVATFYMMLQGKHLVPVSTLQKIIEEYTCIHDLGQEYQLDNLKKSLLQIGISQEQIATILAEVSAHDLFRDCHHSRSGELRTNHMRQKFYKSNFSFISPVELRLGNDDYGNACTYQYIPIKDTLLALLSDPSVRMQISNPEINANNSNILYDIGNGSVYKSNSFFKAHPQALQIILYQDAFEIVNPLGSAKKKHKLLGVYCTLANLYSWNRSSIEQMQLVLLCKESYCKKFGAEVLFSKLVDDLKDLETCGITVQETTYRGTISCIVGDNLGSHYIGGFVENFAFASHVCRYCLLPRQEFVNDPLHSQAAARTPEAYNDALDVLKANSDLTECQGIKRQSVFNSLDHFHVCLPGLPPCLGHDLFEGVVDYDLALCLKYFVKIKKWFTYDYLNRKIKVFPYSGTDAADKPCAVNPNGERLGGHAMQNWCLMRLLPLIILDHIEDVQNEVWQMVLLLVRLTGLICAPKVSLGQVAYMQILVTEYLEARLTLFPDTKLRPKHHYLSHYPSLTLKFGPLIRTWTMRFESKHSYFKRCIRYAQNFKSVEGLLADRHQILQCYQLSGSLFKKEIQVNSATAFYADLHTREIQNAVMHLFLSPSNTIVTDRCTFRGTLFKKDHYLAVRNETNNLLFARILLCLVKNERDLIFVAANYDAELIVEQEAWSVHETGVVACVAHKDLVHEHPVNAYRIGAELLIPLHYAALDDF